MQINPSLLSNIPDTLAMPIMIGFLMSLRNRHSRVDTRSWLTALVFLFFSQVAWLFHGTNGTGETLALVAELLAGLAFASYRGNTSSYRDFDLAYLLWNSLALVTIEALSGMKVHSFPAYFTAIIAGITILIVSTLVQRQEVYRAACGLLVLLLLLVPVALGQYVAAGSLLLAAAYGYSAYNFKQRLQKGSVGRIGIVGSMALLAAFYAVHPWLLHHSDLLALAEQIARMQKFVVSAGMLLVLVENQSARNHYLALHDQLTGIPNRRMLDGSLKTEIETAQKASGRLALAMIDLNGFKDVNDTYGHLAGDHVLHEIALRLRSHLRASELVARMGGDEFVVITRAAVSEEQVKVLEASIRKWIREPIDWDGRRLWIDASVGSAKFPEDVARWSDDVSRETPDKLAGALLRIADMRMYAQKPSSRAGLAEFETIFPTRTLLQ